MSLNSQIEWTDATWNPVRGCTKISPGCKHCYAETFAERFRGVKGHPYQQGFDLRLVPEKLTEPFTWRSPKPCLREFHERPVSAWRSRRVCRGCFASDGQSELTHLSGAHKKIRATNGSLERATPFCSGPETDLVGSKRRRPEIRASAH
jgi:hypothetical protein